MRYLFFRLQKAYYLNEVGQIYVFLLIIYNKLIAMPLHAIKYMQMLGCYSMSMEKNLLYTILLLMYLAPLLAANAVAFRILYLRMLAEI